MEAPLIKSQKRVCDDETDSDTPTDPSEQAKRFKIIPDKVAIKGSRLHERLLHHNVLTPISEISHYMGVTTLNNTPTTGQDKAVPPKKVLNFDGDCLDENANDCTPMKACQKPWKPTNFINVLNGEDSDRSSQTSQKTGDNLATDKAKEKEGYSTNSRARRSFGGRRLNMDASMNEVAMDELSFYEDDASSSSTGANSQQTAARSFTASPQLMGLLSPECSPQRFQIVEKPDSKYMQNVTISSFSRPAAPATTCAMAMAEASPAAGAKNLRMFHSLSSGSMESSMDDEYMDLFEMESLEQQMNAANPLNFPSNLNSLISGQIKSSSSAATPATAAAHTALAKTPEMRRPSVRRCLSMTENHQAVAPKTPEFLKKAQEHTPTNCFKRPEPPVSATCSPIQSKRYRSGEEKENLDSSLTTLLNGNATATATTTTAATTRPVLRKCISMNDAEIMSALARSENKDEPDLIGDFSKPFALPLMEGRHRDLKSISSDTVARLLRGEFADQVASYKIIDCRYPYEFEGGHIRGAQNLYTQEQVMEEFLTLQKTEQHQARNEAAGHKRNIIIFHCEFSSERGPKLSRFLRNTDRARNTNSYPALDYPEVYLLHNGYKEFYETHADLCDPIAYRPMLEPSYSEEYRHFRAKSKSWNGDGLGGTTRLKKSRSRLML